MGSRTDAALALFVLAAVVVAFVLVDTALSWGVAGVGGFGTIAFELLAARDSETVRRYWERPLVQAFSVAAALLGIGIGAAVAPAIVLSAAFGALVTYLGFLIAVGLRRRRRRRRRRSGP